MRRWERKYIAREEASGEAVVREKHMVGRARMAQPAQLVKNIPNRRNATDTAIGGTTLGEPENCTTGLEISCHPFLMSS